MACMEREPLGRVRLWLGGLAAGGVVLAHQLAYLTAAPHPHERAELMRAAGHRNWSLVVALATGLMVAGLAGFVRRGLGGGAVRAVGRGVASRLALLQGGAFLLLEATERSLAGADALSALGEPVVLLGFLLQAVVALIGAGLVKLLARAIYLLSTPRTTRRRPARRVSFPRPSVVIPRFCVCAGSGDLRGPPHTAF